MTRPEQSCSPDEMPALKSESRKKWVEPTLTEHASLTTLTQAPGLPSMMAILQISTSCNPATGCRFH